MGLSRPLIVKWVVLTITANALGAGIGTLYALSAGADRASAVSNSDPISTTDYQEPERGHPLDWDRVAPSTPTPLTPANGAITGARPKFTWAPSEDVSPFIYVIEFSPDPNFTPETVTRVSNILEPEWQTPEEMAFPPVVRQYWRVYAIDAGNNESNRSQAFSFVPTPLPADAEIAVDAPAP